MVINQSKIDNANEILKKFILLDVQLEQIKAKFWNSFIEGLENEAKATLKMFITYVTDVPSGQEYGKYVALDLGGTNFRIILIFLDGSNISMDSEIFEIDENLKQGDVRKLFARIVECLLIFSEQKKIDKDYIPVGFTFSFPCLQYSLLDARISQWTKGYKFPVEKDQGVNTLFNEALEKLNTKKVNIELIAILNDTTGTLMSCAHLNRDCRVGLIVGTGSNLCYFEKTENIPKWNKSKNSASSVIINTEWGAFGDDGSLDFIRTTFDEQVDKNSINFGSQLFEKMISGMYLGEIVRTILVDMCDKNIIFGGNLPSGLKNVYGFSAKHVSRLCDTKNAAHAVEKVLTKINCKNYNETDIKILQMVANRVVERAASLVAAGLASVLNRMKREKCVIGYDGSVIKLHPTFKKIVEEYTKRLTPYPFSMLVSEDGSGRGAALVAAMVSNKLKKLEN